MEMGFLVYFRSLCSLSRFGVISHLNRDEIMKYGVTEMGNMFLMTVLIYPQVFMAFGMGLNEFHVFPDCKTLFWNSWRSTCASGRSTVAGRLRRLPRQLAGRLCKLTGQDRQGRSTCDLGGRPVHYSQQSSFALRVSFRV